jgi:hypothetical protein
MVSKSKDARAALTLRVGDYHLFAAVLKSRRLAFIQSVSMMSLDAPLADDDAAQIPGIMQRLWGGRWGIEPAALDGEWWRFGNAPPPATRLA